MEDYGQTVCYSLESLNLGQVYTASVSIETVFTQWMIDTKLHLNSNFAPNTKGPPWIDFELSFDRGARDRPIVCLSVNPNAGTWTGCIFCTLEEARNCLKIARKMGLRREVFKRLLARTKTSQSIQFADVLINVEHNPNIPWPNHQGFNGEGSPNFYMFCLPVIFPFPQNGRLKLHLSRVARVVDDAPAYPCPGFFVDPAAFEGIWGYIRKMEEVLERAIESKLWRKGGNARVKGTGDEENRGSREYGERMQTDSNEEMGQDSGCRYLGKRKREYDGGEGSKKRRTNLS